MLRMSIDNIKKYMSEDIVCQNWHHWKTTNCYAYSLRLDVFENEICNFAFDPGHIGYNVNGTNTGRIETPEEAVEFMLHDLDALGISYEEVNDPINGGKPLDMDEDSWDILVFMQPEEELLPSVHYAIMGSDGKLYHKLGWHLKPKETTIEHINSFGYQYYKMFRVKLNKEKGSK